MGVRFLLRDAIGLGVRKEVIQPLWCEKLVRDFFYVKAKDGCPILWCQLSNYSPNLAGIYFLCLAFRSRFLC